MPAILDVTQMHNLKKLTCSQSTLLLLRCLTHTDGLGTSFADILKETSVMDLVAVCDDIFRAEDDAAGSDLTIDEKAELLHHVETLRARIEQYHA